MLGRLPLGVRPNSEDAAEGAREPMSGAGTGGEACACSHRFSAAARRETASIDGAPIAAVPIDGGPIEGGALPMCPLMLPGVKDGAQALKPEPPIDAGQKAGAWTLPPGSSAPALRMPEDWHQRLSAASRSATALMLRLTPPPPPPSVGICGAHWLTSAGEIPLPLLIADELHWGWDTPEAAIPMLEEGGPPPQPSHPQN